MLYTVYELNQYIWRPWRPLCSKKKVRGRWGMCFFFTTAKCTQELWKDDCTADSDVMDSTMTRVLVYKYSHDQMMPLHGSQRDKKESPLSNSSHS